MTARSLAVMTLLLVRLVHAQDTRKPTPVPLVLDVKEWRVPWEKTRPRDPWVDRAGHVWFVGQEGNYVAMLDTVTGTFKRFAIDSGMFPHNLLVDPAGTVWFTGNRNGTIGRLDPSSGAVRAFPIPDSAARDPHTMVRDRAGDLWFTVQNGNFVGRIRPKTGEIRVVHPPTARARPYGITLDSRGRIWFVEFGTNRIATIDTSSMKITEYPLPNERSRPRRIAATPDGALWYVDYTRAMLGRFDPGDGSVKEWPNPGGPLALPYAMASDDRGRLWYVETGMQPNRLVGFDPRTEQVMSITPIRESGGLTVRHMFFHQPSRTLWFGTDANTIARARVP